MRKVLMIFFVAINLNLTAQKTILYNSMNGNILWIGIPNYLSFNSSFGIRDFTFKVSEGEIELQNGNTVIVRVKKTGKKTLFIYKKGKLFEKKTFVSKRILPPYASISFLKKNKTGGELHKNSIPTSFVVSAPVLGMGGYKLHFEVIRFKVIAVYNSKKAEVKVKGSIFSDKNHKILKPLDVGHMLLITDIFAQAPDKTLRRLNDIVFSITDN